MSEKVLFVRSGIAALSVGCLIALSGPRGVLHACDDPSLHPEMAEYLAVVDALGPQPASPVQLRYLAVSERERMVGKDLLVKLSFWPLQPYQNGHFEVKPSDGLILVDLAEPRKIPDKGVFTLTIRAIRSGYHYLRIETFATQGSEEIRATTLIPFPIGLEHPALASSSSRASGAAGFAGPRMRELLETGQPMAPRSQEQE